MPHGVQRAEVLHVKISHTLFANKRRLGRHHQLVVRRSQDRVRDTFLGDRLAVIKPLDSIALGQEIRASSTADLFENLIDERAGELWRDVGDIVQAQESGTVRWRCDGEDPLHDFFDSFAELRHVQDLEGAFGVADEIYFGGAGLLFDGFDESGDFVRGGCDGFEAADEGEEVVLAIRGGECTVSLSLQVEFEDVYIFIIRCAEAVEEDDGVRVGFAAAGEVVVDGDSFGDWG